MFDALAQEALQSALRQLLQPVAQLVLAHGLPYGALDALVRAALVEQARGLADEGGNGHGLVSRVSAATGLTRREAGRLLEAGGQSPVSVRHGLAAEVFARWLSDPGYRENGRLRVLARQGAAPSFEALAQSVTRDMHPRTLLGELCRLELVHWDTDADTVALQREAFVPRADRTHMLGLLAANVGDHLRAAVDNVLGAGDAHFEQAVFADELSAESIQALRPVIAAQWIALFRVLAPELDRRIADDRGHGRTADQRVRIGFYSYSAPMDAPPGPPAAAGGDGGAP